MSEEDANGTKSYMIFVPFLFLVKNGILYVKSIPFVASSCDDPLAKARRSKARICAVESMDTCPNIAAWIN